MKFLVDQAVSWQVAHDLQNHGYDAIHVRDIDLAAVPDEAILAQALADDRIIITQDTDFGTLLARAGTSRPSILLLRLHDGHPAVHTRLILGNLRAVENDLTHGAIVVLTDAGIRVRRLPC